MFELIDNATREPIIKVIGVGGGGGNAVEHMVTGDIAGVDFICANTDAQALKILSAKTLLQLGASVTKGMGAGSDPELGKLAALEDRDRIAEVLQGADMVFITAGMGGGTGTGGAPIVAEVARELDLLTVAVVTKPFPFEGKKRLKNAEAGIKELSENVDSLITIPNEKLLSIMGEDTPLLEAFGAVDDVLCGAVQGIADLIVRPGKINVDFADVKTVMLEMGMAMMGSGSAKGETRAKDAAELAIKSRLLDEVDIHGARGILVNITAGVDISLGEFAEVGATIEAYASDNATVVIGTVIDPEMTDEIRVTVVATGLGNVDIAYGRKSVDKTQKILAGDGTPDYAEFDKPTVIRNRGTLDDAQVGKTDMEYLDIPAFLRRQAD